MSLGSPKICTKKGSHVKYRRLGKSGLKVSELSFGTWVTFSNQLDESKGRELMESAYDAGINFFDSAETYADGQAEVLLGKIFRETKWRRDTFTVSSKVFWGGELPTQRGLSRKHVHDACHAALRRLQVDYLDLYFCHRPDIQTPIEETVRAMNTLIEQGKVLYWGTSEWSAQQIMEAYSVARQYNLIPPTMEQPQYNMFHRERVEKEYLRLYEEIGLGSTIWSPLASGVLTGKYAKGIPSHSRVTLPGYEWLKMNIIESQEGQSNIAKTERLRSIASDIGASLSQLAIAWCLRVPYVSTVILGATSKKQLEENIAAKNIVAKLTSDVIEAIENILENEPETARDY